VQHKLSLISLSLTSALSDSLSNSDSVSSSLSLSLSLSLTLSLSFSIFCVPAPRPLPRRAPRALQRAGALARPRRRRRRSKAGSRRCPCRRAGCALAAERHLHRPAKRMCSSQVAGDQPAYNSQGTKAQHICKCRVAQNMCSGELAVYVMRGEAA
jgi:hypothetical protein